jgi:hypothetical protein
MAEMQGQDSKVEHDSHAHDHPLEEEVLRTPTWMPILGFALLLLGALSTYLWIHPGRLNTSSESGGETPAAEPSTP